MRVRYWFSWRSHNKEYEDVIEDDSITKEELEKTAQDIAEERCEAAGWYEILKDNSDGE
jgi:hypothetical protein